MPGLSSLLPDYIDRNLYRRDSSSVLKPVSGVPVLGPAHSRPIVRSDSISMVSDRSLQYVDGAWPVFMVMNRAEDASWFDSHHTHPKLAPCHALNFRAKVNRCKYLHRNTFRLWCRQFVAHCILPFVLRHGGLLGSSAETAVPERRNIPLLVNVNLRRAPPCLFQAHPQAGLMFWFIRKKFAGSYFFLSSTNRLYVVP